MFQTRKIWNVLIALAFTISILWSGPTFAGVRAAPMMNETAQTIPFFQGWTDTSQITIDHNWSNVPGIIGYREGMPNTPPVERDPRLILSPVPDGTLQRVYANRSDLETDFGPIEFEFFNPTIALRGSSTHTAPHIQVSLNTTGKTNPLFLYYRARDVDYLERTAIERLAVQYRIGNTGDFTNIPEGYIEAATTNIPYDATKVTAMVVPLPAAVNDQALVQLRFITADVVATDQWIGIDDITVDENLPPFVNTVTPADGQMAVPAGSTISLVLSEPGVALTNPWYSLTCAGNTIATTYSQSVTPDDTIVTITPTSPLPAGSLCTLLVDENKTQVQDSTGKTMLQPFASQFTVSGCGSANTTKISAVQGTGEISSIAGQSVTVEGIITNIPTFAVGSTMVGFYIQSADDSDSNPASSEGLFVEVPSTMLSIFNLGQKVRLTGTVDEYTSAAAGEMAKMTRLSSVDILSREICATGQSVTPTTVDLSQVNSQTYLERFEGMLVNVTGGTPSSLTIQQNEYLGRFGQMILGRGGRIYHPNNGTGGLATDVNRMIVLDDSSAVQYPNPIPFYLTNTPQRAGDLVTGVAGVLDQGRINGSTSTLEANLVFPNVYYRVQKTSTPTFTVAGRPTSPPLVNGTIKVASFNVDNYFTTLGSLGATTADELTRQQDKLVRAIAGIGADVIALQGIEAVDTANAVASLLAAVNGIAANNFAVVADPTTGTGPGLTQVVLMYKKSSVTPVGASLSKVNASFTTSYPVAQLFQVASGQKFVVVGAQFASTNQTAQANALLSFINTNLKPLDPDVVVAGDLNTYAADGVIATLVAGGLTNQVVANGPTFPYSYVANGAAGYRDYILTTLAANRQVEKVDFWHINADEPAIIDYNTELKTVDLYVNNVFRSAVHDPVMIGLTLVANQVPVVSNPIPNQPATEDVAFSYQFPANTFTDPDSPDDQVVTYDAKLAGGAALPAWLSFNATTRTFSGTPGNADVGQITVEVRAFDYTGQVDPTVYGTDQFVITVANVNDAPTVANEIPDKTASEDVAFNFAFAADTFSEIDQGDSLTYVATKADGSALPTWLSFTPASRTFSGTPGNADVAVFTVKVTATDTNLASVSDQFVMTVANVNDAPTLANPIDDQSATQGVDFSLTFAANTFNDIDAGDSFTYTATKADGSPLPTWLTFDAPTRTFLGTPTNADVGNLTVKLTAKDTGDASVSDEFVITVANVNDPPAVNVPLPDRNVTVNRAFSFQFASNTFADIDVGDLLTYTATLSNGDPLPAWLQFNGATRTFSGTPTVVETIAVKVIATDTSSASVSDVFNLSVRVNSPPVVSNGLPGEQNATEDVAFSFTFASNTFTDPDLGDTLTYTATKGDGSPLPTWLGFDGATRTFSGTPANEDVGTFIVLVTATDNSNESASDSFNLIVANVNDAPVVDKGIANKITSKNVLFTFTIPEDAFKDLDVGDSFTYTATLESGQPLPDWLDFSVDTFTGTPAPANIGMITIKVTAKDNSDATGYTTFKLTVTSTFQLYLPAVRK